MELRRILYTLSHRRWLVIGIVAVTVVTVGVGSLFLPPSTVFVARATLMPSEYALYGGEGVSGRSAAGRESRLANLRQLAACRAVASRAVHMMGGDSAAALQKDVAVIEPRHESWQPGSDLILLQVKGRTPAQAIRRTRAMSAAFVTFYEDLAKSGASATRAFLEREAATAREELDTRKAALAAYQRSTGMPGVTAELEASSRYKDLAQIRDALEMSRADYEEVSAALAQASAELAREPASIVENTGTSDSPISQQLENQLAALEAQLASETAVHTAEHPSVVALQSRVASVRARLAEERGRMAPRKRVVPNPVYAQLMVETSRLRRERAAAAGKIGALEAALARRQGAMSGLVGADLTLDALTGDYKQAQAAYANMLSRLRQARLDERVAASQAAVNIVDLPTSAEGPIRQGRGPLELMLAGAALSFMLAMALALGLDALDVRLERAEDVLARMKLPVTATIPNVAGVSAAALPRTTQLAPLSPHAEAYRFLRSELVFSDPERDVRAILVAAPKPGQGATTTASNLAISMAQGGKRVILVDGDLRRPSLHEVFSVPMGPGLSDFLEGEAELVEVVKPTDMANLLVMPAGRPTTRPAELLCSERMRALVGDLKRHADYIIFDSPAAVAFTDATLLSSVVDGVLLVVRASVRFTAAEITVRQRMEKAGANFLGVVLNDLPPEAVESYRYHASYYGATARAGTQPAALQEPS